MKITRNFIDIEGIIPEDEFPNNMNNGHITEYSETEYIFIPQTKYDINKISQISININIDSYRLINTSLSKIVIIDGKKKLKIIYTDNRHSSKIKTLYIETPYNTFIELPNDKKLGKVTVSIIDAYFQLIDARTVYSHIVYMLNVDYAQNNIFSQNNTDIINVGKEDFIEEFQENQNTEFENYSGEKVEFVKNIDDELSISKTQEQTIDIDSEYL